MSDTQFFSFKDTVQTFSDRIRNRKYRHRSHHSTNLLRGIAGFRRVFARDSSGGEDMTIVFGRPTGVHADIKELEYVLALLQTQKTLSDSVSTKDLSIYLASRHGVKVHACELDGILDLAGHIHDSSKNETVVLQEGEKAKAPKLRLDLLQIATLLLIPELREAKTKNNLEQYSVVLERVLRQEGVSVGSLFTEDNLRHLFYHLLGENDIAPELVTDMIQVAKDSLSTALTSDIEDYDTSWWEKWTTHYDDAMSVDPKESVAPQPGTDARKDEEFQEKTEGNIKPLSRGYTAPSIDFAADTFKRPILVMCMW